MGYRRIPVKCTVCGEETALVGEDITTGYVIEHFEASGWSFSKYKTMCPKCKEEESKKFQQVVMDI